MILLTHMYFRSCGSKLREMENDHAKTSSTNKIISRAARAKNLQRINMPCKGQLISKANYQSVNSSENRTQWKTIVHFHFGLEIKKQRFEA